MYLKTHLGKHLYIHAYLQNILRCICNLCHYVIVMIIYQLLIADPSLNSFRKDIVYPHAPLITHYRSFDLLVVSQSHAGNRYQSSLITDKTQICQPIEIGIVLKIHYSSARTTWSWQSYFSIAGISIPKHIYITLDLGFHIQRRCQAIWLRKLRLVSYSWVRLLGS